MRIRHRRLHSLLLAAAGGLALTAGAQAAGPARPTFYTGYYLEDPAANPEDPTAGFVYACLPEKDGTFTAQFLFSFVGCMGGIDVGGVEGRKTGTTLSGEWSGTVDGRAIGGGYEGRSNPGDDVYTGTWTNKGGKTFVQVGACHYYVSPRGTWKLYGPGVRDFKLNVQSSGGAPTLSWDPVPGAAAYQVAVYAVDQACGGGGFGQSLMWLALTYNTRIRYGEGLSLGGGMGMPISPVMELVPHRPLEPGKRYVVVVQAVRTAGLTGVVPANAVVGFARQTLVP